MKKIALIGIGGRTGTMLAFELQKAGEVLGIGREKEINIIQEKRFYLRRGREAPLLFEGEVIKDSEFPKDFWPDIIFLAIKNPVGPALRYYYQKIKDFYSQSKNGKFPDLVLSQNGIRAAKEAREVLKEILGEKAENLRIIRISLFNPVEREEINGKIYLNYFLPIRLTFGIFSGPKGIKDIKEVFEEAKIEAEEVSSKDIENMEFSKLLINLIGMAAAAKGLSIQEGFEDKETFKEEILALKEYIKVARKKGIKFLNFKHYPIKLLTLLISFLPIPILSLFRKKLARVITKSRGGKTKGNLDEIDYYNGEVIKLGKELGIETPFNQKIYQRIKEGLE